MLSRVEHEKSFITMGPIWIQSRGMSQNIKENGYSSQGNKSDLKIVATSLEGVEWMRQLL